MSSTPFLFRVLNPIMKAILGSPFHAMVSKQIMVITFNGKRSGKAYSTPVSYYRENGEVICFTHGSWWKNIGSGAEVMLKIAGRDLRGYAVAIADDVDLKAAYLQKMLKAVPFDAQFYKVKLDERGEPDEEDVRKGAEDAVMVRITVSS